MKNNLRARGLRIDVIGARAEHGTRLRYVAMKCRCDLCRRANSVYQTEREKAQRRGDWNGIVPAARARAKINKLSSQGVGRRSIAAVTDVSATIIHEIKMGRRRFIRARTERKILEVTPDLGRSDAARVPAARLWALLEDLRDEGFADGVLARRLGYSTPQLQFNKNTVTVKNLARVERLHRSLTA